MKSNESQNKARKKLKDLTDKTRELLTYLSNYRTKPSKQKMGPVSF